MNLQPLAEIRSLEALSFTDTQVKDLKPLSGLTKLQGLWLDNTEVHDLEPLKDLQKLDLLSARNLHLDRVPDFCIARVSELRLEGTTIAKQPEALFRLPREKIFEAYCFQTKVKINEGKVIFLGESGVGKTHTVLRLEQKGVQKDYKTDSTPGVDIRPYDCGDGTRINFWDFGGQEIMQSMHRCFLTERTCYVVVVSNRDPGTAMPQARKWLRTVAGFSDQVSVLLAVNQWHNASAESEIDPKELRDICPRLTDIIYFSAKNDSPEVFNERITKAILRQVQKLDSIRLELPQSWADIRRELLDMEQNYITLEDYRRVCAKHGLSGNDDNTESIRMWLLDWFNDMGICFSYHKNAPMSAKELREYKVLRPAWLTNGIYRILNNGVHLSASARLSKEDLHELLNSEQYNTVYKNYKYKTKEERKYILEVMRKFQHSYYCAEEDKEFIPGVLPARKPEHIEPTYLGEPLVYTMKLTYLPASLVHRLMIALWEKMDGVQWRFGARFREGDTVLVVEANEEKALLSFRLYRKTWEEDDYCELFHEARNRILQECREMRLVVEKETISLQKEGSRAEYELNALIEAFERTNGTNDPILMNQEGKFRMFTFVELLYPLFNREILDLFTGKAVFGVWHMVERTRLLNITTIVYQYATSDTMSILPPNKREIIENAKHYGVKSIPYLPEFLETGFMNIDTFIHSEYKKNLSQEDIAFGLVILSLNDPEFPAWLSKNGTKIEKLQTQENKKKKEPEVGRMRIAGVNRDLLEWAKQSKLYHSAVGTADPEWEALEHALDPNETNRFVGSMELMKTIWATHPELGLAPDYDLLAALEHGGAFYPNYRDHLTHMFKVFLLGLYLYENHETLREAIQKVWQEKEFLAVWIMTALWHDMGYLIENEDKSRNGQYAQQMLNWLKQMLSLPLTHLFPDTFDAGMEGNFQSEDCGDRMLLPKTAATMLDLEKKLSHFNGFGRSVRLTLSNDGNPIEVYYQYTALPREERNLYDHGIVSACILLYVRDALCHYLEKSRNVEMFDDQKEKVDLFLAQEELYQNYAQSAAEAIAVHNLRASSDRTDVQELNQRGVTIGQFKIPMEKEPIAYLLRLCDELQCWDRKRFTPQKEYSFDSDRLIFSRQIRDGANTVVLEIHDEKEKRKVRDALAGLFDPPAETFLGE